MLKSSKTLPIVSLEMYYVMKKRIKVGQTDFKDLPSAEQLPTLNLFKKEIVVARLIQSAS